jgi:hypothetical protein
MGRVKKLSTVVRVSKRLATWRYAEVPVRIHGACDGSPVGVQRYLCLVTAVKFTEQRATPAPGWSDEVIDGQCPA